MSSLRGETSNRFKKAHANLAGVSSNLQEILQKAQFQRKTVLNGSRTESREKTPEFDCSGGLRLSESDGSDDEPTTSAKAIASEKKQTSSLINSINQASSTPMVDLRSNVENLQQLEKIKSRLLNYESRNKGSDTQKENVNIADLLAIGEGVGDQPSTSSQKKASQKRSRQTQREDSDSDDGWEEVEGKRIKIQKYKKILKRFEYDG